MQRRAIALTLFLAACGSGSDPVDPSDPTRPEFPLSDQTIPLDPDEPQPPPNAAPVVKIVFPPPASTTDAASIVVRGTAADADGVAEVRVNGTLAETTDGFATWRLELPLAAGANPLVITSTDALGAHADSAARADVLVRDLLTTFPTGIVADATHLFGLERETGRLIATERATGRRSLVAGGFRAVPDLVLGIPMTIDRTHRELFVGKLSSITGIDVATGTKRSFAAADVNDVGALAVDEAAGILYVVDLFEGVFAIDLATKEATTISSATRGSGPELRFPTGVALDRARNRLLVPAGRTRALMAIDLTTGDRTIASSATTGSGPMFKLGIDLAFDAANDRVVLADDNGVFAIALATGNRERLDAAGTPDHIALDPTTNELFAESLLGLARIDLATSGSTPLTDPDFGTGTPVMRGSSLLATPTGALIADSTGGPQRLISLDLATRERAIVNGVASISVVDLAPGHVLSLDSRELRDLDLAAQASRLIVADEALHQTQSVARDPNGDRAFVLTTFAAQILAIDLATGARSPFFDLENGTGATSGQLAMDDAENRLLFTDSTRAAVFAIDLATNELAALGGPSFPGIALADPEALAIDRGRQQLLVGDGNDLLSLDLAFPHLVRLANGSGPAYLGITAIAVTSDDRALVSDLRGVQLIDLATGHHVIVAGH